jgi:serine/threonine-protein kinase
VESQPARRPGPPPPPPPTQGALLGGRYKLSGFIGRSPYGEILRAEDTHDGQTVAMRRLRPALASGPVRERLAAEIARACSLEHPHIVKPLDMLSDDAHLYVVSRHVPAQTLRSIIAARKGRFTVRDAAGVVSQICSALAYASPLMPHGGLTASNVLVEATGQVRVAEYGLARAVPLRLDELDPADRVARAPEGPDGDARADLYAAGAILFELLCGKPFVRGVLPRNVRPDLSPILDALCEALLDPDPAARMDDAEEVRQKLAVVVAEVEKDLDSRREQQAQRTSSSQRPVKESREKRRKVKVDHHEHRWLVHKGKLDYGPYTLVELREKIEKHEVVPGDIVIDMELGTRAEAEAHPLLHDLVHAAAQVRDDERRVEVETTAVAHEKRRGVALYAFLGLAGAALIAGAVYLVGWLRAGERTGPRKEAEIALADLSGLKVGSARRDDDREAQRRARAARSGRPAAAPAAGSQGFDDALSFDMVGEEVGDERLSDEQIDGVLGRHSSSLGRCLAAEAARGGARQADIDFIVLGSGKVSQVRVNGQSGTPLAACVRAAMSSMQFPSFDGPRTKASFAMSL